MLTLNHALQSILSNQNYQVGVLYPFRGNRVLKSIVEIIRGILKVSQISFLGSEKIICVNIPTPIFWRGSSRRGGGGDFKYYRL